MGLETEICLAQMNTTSKNALWLFFGAHMGLENWDEIRTAYQVARIGTVSGAADVLGVHHATVIRHIDALEGRLGAKLFQRHSRGYTPTEAGAQLLSVAQATEDQFAQLAARIAGAGEEVSGELIVTALPTLSALVLPALQKLMVEHPGLRLRYLTDPRIFRLEYGEAHVAVRAGTRPSEPDNVVQVLARQQHALYAAPSYADAHGLPASEAELTRHRFIASDVPDSRAPFFRWLAERVAADRIVFRSNEADTLARAIRQGIGLGFLPVQEARAERGLIEVIGPRPEWDAALWLVTHVDLHRTPKVQAVLQALKDAASATEVSS